MKRKFLKSSINLITKDGNYTEEDIEIISYGLETVYLMVTKLIVIFSLAYLLDVFKEMFILLITYNIIRSQSFGIHATKSIYCLISSIIMFIGGAFICKHYLFPSWLLISGAFISVICLFIYAPADTYKRPLINKKKRKKFKFISSILGIIYTILIILLGESYIANYLFLGMVEAIILILPLTYKLFKLPYNNYKNYKYGV